MTATITPEAGGTITSADGRFRLDFPPGAVSESVEITITRTPAAEVPADVFPAGISYDLEPSGLQFAVPVTATFTFTRAEMLARAEADFVGFDAEARPRAMFPAVLETVDADGTESDLDNQSMEHIGDGSEVVVTGELAHFTRASCHLLNIEIILLTPIKLGVGETKTYSAHTTIVDQGGGNRQVTEFSVLGAETLPGADPILSASVTSALPVLSPPGTSFEVSYTCNQAGEGPRWGGLGVALQIATTFRSDIWYRTTLFDPYKCVILPPVTCSDPLTTIDEGETLDIPALVPQAIDAANPMVATCGVLIDGGAVEEGGWTRMRNLLAVWMIRVQSAGLLTFDLGWPMSARGGSLPPDLDLFVARTTIQDPWYVGDPDILHRFNGSSNPEIGLFNAQPGDYLIIVHNYNDSGPVAFDLTATFQP